MRPSFHQIIVRSILLRLKYSHLRVLLTLLLRVLNKKGDVIITYKERPKRSENVSFDPQGRSYHDFAIVLQGPVVTEDDFTLETVKLYLKHFPNVTVIVSTWIETERSVQLQFQQLKNVFLLLNEKPPVAGVSNVNLQLFSTMQGLQAAKSAGKRYAVKTRCDQRIYNSSFLLCADLLVKMPLGNDSFGLKNRLIVSSLGSLKFRPYGISDMLMIGETNDLINYWGIDLDRRKVSEIKHKPNISVREYAEQRIAETYILSEFLRKKGIKSDFSIRHTWEVYRDLFIILDKESFNIYWHKYSTEKEDRLGFYEEHIYREISFLEWLSLSGAQIIPEQVLDKTIIVHTL